MVEDKKKAFKSPETESSKLNEQPPEKLNYIFGKNWNKKLYFKKRDVSLMPQPYKPDFIQKVDEVIKEEAKFNEKQKKYRENVVSPSDLRKKSPAK